MGHGVHMLNYLSTRKQLINQNNQRQASITQNNYSSRICDEEKNDTLN